ncbi:hypothetical protein Ga0080574_TMP2553 [Salipiger abyssi]|uniref:Uncharacterized protein n=1 Tax=Salipiger abyssi TaxID=1250539 RepID=A0A1P8UU17_9RHOB|nr:hypothetical protein Ga0080574_TMP2553 [Salipiger abyssi]
MAIPVALVLTIWTITTYTLSLLWALPLYSAFGTGFVLLSALAISCCTNR